MRTLLPLSMVVPIGAVLVQMTAMTELSRVEVAGQKPFGNEDPSLGDVLKVKPIWALCQFSRALSFSKPMAPPRHCSVVEEYWHSAADVGISPQGASPISGLCDHHD